MPLKDVKHALGYLDGIIIFSEDTDSHYDHIKQVLKMLDNAGLKVNREKCDFFQTEIQFLGHKITREGIKAIPKSKMCISEIKPPKNRNELLSFLGFSGYFQKFIRNYASIATCLYRLTSKYTEFVWSPDCEKAFRDIKKCLSDMPLLRFTVAEQPLHLFTDSSNTAIGVSLSQLIDGEQRPIIFSSRKLSASEANYSTIDREMLAIVWSVKKLRYYLLGRKFIIHTDHNPLKYLASFQDSHGRRARWLTILQEYN
ncbi:Retrovirus-related Pol polyprotein from transposon opus [Thelohanellus kitauei]|uniref:Retrovirus-related Pol polyprotein from transposon opus n=1 Tax=Thelohanellus kitauei TaxID=669202 RepID=A0A0C2MTM5_THEKT|nr:Retrovirus-related Pol polyprotein from transposon opus [Thelohanellus kitauei]